LYSLLSPTTKRLNQFHARWLFTVTKFLTGGIAVAYHSEVQVVDVEG